MFFWCVFFFCFCFFCFLFLALTTFNFFFHCLFFILLSSGHFVLPIMIKLSLRFAVYCLPKCLSLFLCLDDLHSSMFLLLSLVSISLLLSFVSPFCLSVCLSPTPYPLQSLTLSLFLSFSKKSILHLWPGNVKKHSLCSTVKTFNPVKLAHYNAVIVSTESSVEPQ